MRRLDEPGQRALAQAIARLEASSALEIVVALRGRSGSYLATALIAGLAIAWATLAVQILAPWPIPHLALLVEPPLLGLLGGWLVARSPLLLRLFTPEAVRRRRALREAMATFVEKSIALTRGRTGLLVYFSLLEGQLVVLGDRAVTGAVTATPWAERVAAFEKAVQGAQDGGAFAAALEAFAAPLAAVLPPLPSDENELPDEVVLS